MVVKAWAFSFFQGYFPAFSDFKLFFYQLEICVNAFDIRVGAEIKRAIIDNLSGPENPWEILVCDPDNRKGFAVFEAYIVSRLPFFYQVVFKDEGFVFGCRGYCLDPVDSFDKVGSFYLSGSRNREI